MLLAGFGWLHDLPRHVSPCDLDCVIHDGAQGRNRFLVLETKRLDEEWPLQKGQAWLLGALAEVERFTVRVLRGSVTDLTVHRVTRTAVEYESGIRTTADKFRGAVVAWLSGTLWRDAEASLGKAAAVEPREDLSDLNWPPLLPLGQPLSEPRLCPSCHDYHPVGTTCAGGWAPWRPA